MDAVQWSLKKTALLVLLLVLQLQSCEALQSLGPRLRRRVPQLAQRTQDERFDAGSKVDDAFLWDEENTPTPLGRAADNFFMHRFRLKLAEELGQPETAFDPGFDGLIAMIRTIHDRERNPANVVNSSRRVLRGLFPNWPPFNPEGTVGLLWWCVSPVAVLFLDLPVLTSRWYLRGRHNLRFGVLFARPFPVFSAKLNAWVTWWAAQWLMGPSILVDQDDPACGDGKAQTLLVQRCRYLEASQCASICVNTCKLPTQVRFAQPLID